MTSYETGKLNESVIFTFIENLTNGHISLMKVCFELINVFSLFLLLFLITQNMHLFLRVDKHYGYFAFVGELFFEGAEYLID